MIFFFFFSSRRRHTRCSRDWSSDVCSSDLSSSTGKLRTAIGLAASPRALAGCVREQPAWTKTSSSVTNAPRGKRLAEQRAHPDKTDRKSTRLNSSHGYISYAVFCLKKKKHKR